MHSRRHPMKTKNKKAVSSPVKKRPRGLRPKSRFAIKGPQKDDLIKMEAMEIPHLRTPGKKKRESLQWNAAQKGVGEFQKYNALPSRHKKETLPDRIPRPDQEGKKGSRSAAPRDQRKG